MAENTFKIFKLSIAKALVNKGFHLEETVPNREKPWLNVYCFTDNKELREAVNRIIASQNA